MVFEESNIEEWFINRSPSEFPHSVDYVTKYKTIKIAVAKYLADATRGGDVSDGISLTWHDSSHISTVIKRASNLIKYDRADLTPYEVYYLLVAIQIHDLGNILGRTGHEARAIDLLDKVYINPDSTERNIINDIVETHSGDIDGDKDKISHLRDETIHNDKIKTRFIAALLRFADELADEPGRASVSLLEAKKLNKGSEIHHLYAHSLTTTYIPKNSSNVNLNFTIEKRFGTDKYGKFDKDSKKDIEVYLLDEIFDRTLKMHIESIYCMRFLRPYISIDKINVVIEVIPQGLDKKIKPIEYQLAERGYPEIKSTIYQLTGEKLKENGGVWNGDLLKKYIIEKLS